MRKITISIFLLSLIFSSCSEDWVDLDPRSNKSLDNHFQTEEDFYRSIIAAYDPLQWCGTNFRTFEYHHFGMLSNILSDDAWSGGGNANDRVGYIQAENGKADPASSDFYARYTTELFGVNRANIVLDQLESATSLPETSKKQFEGEARFLRAKYYFNLVRMWGRVPLVDKIYSLEELKAMPQAKPGEIYNLIASDLYQASDLLPEEVADEDVGRATKWAAKALLVRVFMFFDGYKGNLDPVAEKLMAGETEINKVKAQQLAEEVLNKSGHGLVKDYDDLFKSGNENNIESIFEVQFSEGSKWGDWTNLAGQEGFMLQQFLGMRTPDSEDYAAGWAYSTISTSLYNEFEDGDKRRFATIIDVNDPAEGIKKYQTGYQNTGYFLKKYYPRVSDASTSGTSEHNWRLNEVLIRYADVMLMSAELHLDDDPAKALGYVNELRKRAGLEELGSIDLDIIYHERRVELAGEGHRYWDLLRRGMKYAKDKINSTNEGGEFSTAFNEAAKGLMPIPQNEIDLANGWIQNKPY